MKSNVAIDGRVFTRRMLARFFKRSIRTIDRWGIARADLLTIKEAARRIGVSERTFYRLRDDDVDFPKPIRIGKADPLWRADELDNYKQRGAAAKSGEQQLSFL